MAKQKENWREQTKRIIEAYPGLLREENELRECKITPSANGMPGGGGVSRSTENVAMRELPPESQRMLDSVRNAIATTNRYRNGKDRLRVIDLVFWKKTHDLHGAALRCHYSYETARDWTAEFVELVDAYMRVL